MTIDLNCDLGESIIDDNTVDAILPMISSCNIACGFHSGDASTIDKTIVAAKTYGVTVGAHPSYPDREGFGRRPMKLAPEELEAIISYQIAAVAGMARRRGVNLRHVKPHGALYNTMATDRYLADTVYRAISSVEPGIVVFGPAGNSILPEVAASYGLKYVGEAFADRKYHIDGSLQSRSIDGALITNPALAATQSVEIALRQRVSTSKGKWLALPAQTICVHGDNPNAVDILRAIRADFENYNIEITAQ